MEVEVGFDIRMFLIVDSEFIRKRIVEEWVLVFRNMIYKVSSVYFLGIDV